MGWEREIRGFTIHHHHYLSSPLLNLPRCAAYRWAMLKVVGASWLQTRISTYILVAVALLGIGAIILGEFGQWVNILFSFAAWYTWTYCKIIRDFSWKYSELVSTTSSIITHLWVKKYFWIKKTLILLCVKFFCNVFIDVRSVEDDGTYSATVSWNYKGGYHIDFWGQSNDLASVKLNVARAYYKTSIFESG